MAMMAGEERASGIFSLAGVKILSTVPQDELRHLETRCTYRRVPAGDVLMQRFGESSAVYFILAGHARVVHMVDGKEEITIASVSDGDALGEISAIDGGGASATVVAEEDCTVAELPKEDFQGLIVRRGEVALSLLRRWAAIIRDLDDKVSLVSSIGPEQRVYSEIIRLARVERPGGTRWYVPEMPGHGELAVRAQTTREAVAGAIAELASRGIAERRTRALYINDFKALKDMVRQGQDAPFPATRVSNR
jgi:CRP/FNR family transcriptional regulator, cyclic AMP receptor protein